MAADVELAGRTLHLEPGAGLCALLAEDPRDAVRIDMIRGAERDLAEVAGYWADCKVLDDWRNGRTKLLMPYVLILAPFPEGHVVVVPFDMPQDEYMAEQKRAILEFVGDNEQLETSRGLLVDRTNEALGKIDQNTNFSADTAQPIGILSEDILAYALLVPTSQGEVRRTIAWVAAPVQLNGIDISVNAYDEMHGPATIFALEGMVRRVVTDLSEKNPTSLP